MASLSLHRVRKRFGATDILHGLSLDVEDGEFVALVGPSGCGKSTLLRLVAGLEPISDGTIRLGSRVINDVAPKERNVAMVFQNYALYPHMTVAENLGFALKLQGAPKQDIAQRVGAAAEVLGLNDLLDRKPRQLSGGQRQRVAMGRAIVRRPDAFLFDEPLSNLDAKLRVQMRTEIKALHQRLGTTTVYVTHDQVEAMTMADRIVVMRNGLVEQIGTPLALYDRPANAFVAGFIGSPAMNFFRGRVKADGGASMLDTEDGLLLPLPPRSALSHGQEILYGVRPEHFSLHDENGHSARVEVTEPTGAETVITARMSGQRVTVSVRERSGFVPGSHIRLAPMIDHVHVFDAATGKRID